MTGGARTSVAFLGTRRRSNNLSGPDRVTGAERAAPIAERKGRPVRFETMTVAALREAMAGTQLPFFVVDAVASMHVAQAEGAYDIVTGDVEKLTGYAPRSLGEVLDGFDLHSSQGR